MKKISLIIPVYNEEKILNQQINKVIKGLKKISDLFYEIILINNGSKDKTLFFAKKIKKKNQNIKVINLEKRSYGQAIKEGILKAKYNIIVQFDIDFFDFNFLKKALILIKNNDIVVGSKLHPKSKDKRPFLRIFLSFLFNFFIKLIFKYKGTDTHGIKIFKKKSVKFLIKNNICHNHLFDTEILIKAKKLGFLIKELPVSLKEMRLTRFPHLARLKEVLEEIFKLIKFWFFIDKKTKLLFEIDDFGYKKNVDEKIVNLIKNKKNNNNQIRIVSVLPNFISFFSLDKIKNNKINLGLHINLVEGLSINKKRKLDSLPFFLFKLFFDRKYLKIIKKEIESQILFFKKNKLKINELNSHQHLHAISPLSEIFYLLAKKYRIKNLRSYKNIYCFTLSAKIKFFILRSFAYFTHFVFYGKFALPRAWQIDDQQSTIILSWEGKDLSFDKIRKKFFQLKLICHPYLGFDNYKKYLKYLK